MKKKLKNSFITIVVLIVMSILFSQIVSSATFGIGVTVCVPDWYCTAYSQDTCGTRTCLDANFCGTDYSKPTEYVACEISTAGGSGGSGSSSNSGSGSMTIINPSNGLPNGYFTINFNNIKITLEQNELEQRIVKINSTIGKDFIMEINYPSSYLGTREFITTTSNKKYIGDLGDFNLIIDTRGVAVGTYVVPVKISNDKYDKEIVLTIDVVPEKNVIKDIILDTKIKTIGADKELELLIDTQGDKISIGDKIEYSIIDPKGNVLYSMEEIIEESNSIKQKIPLPLELSEGYYTISAKVENSNGVFVKSAQFTLLTPNKYYPVLQKPKNINLFNILTGVILLIIIGVIIHNKLYADTLGARKFRSELKWRKSHMNTKIIDLKIRDRLKRLANKFTGKKADSLTKAELLKQSYEKGYISLKEYNDALDSEGYHVGKDSGVSLDSAKKLEKNNDLEDKSKISSEHHHEHHAHTNISTEVPKEIKPIDKSDSSKIELKEIKEEKHPKSESKIEEKDSKEEKPKDEIINVKELLQYVKEEATIHKIADPKPKHEIPKENILEHRTHNQAFILSNGVTLHSLGDLLRSLEYMPLDVFNHHISNGRNDFATWVWDVFKYGDIAEDIRSSKTKEDLLRVLKKYE